MLGTKRIDLTSHEDYPVPTLPTSTFAIDIIEYRGLVILTKEGKHENIVEFLGHAEDNR